MHRVCTLIPFLNHQKLCPPNLFTKIPYGKAYKLARYMTPSEFGEWMEYVLACFINNKPIKPPAHLKEHFNIKDFDDIAEWIKELEPVQYQVELTDHDIQGHIDFMSFNTVYDVKTTGQFNKMRMSTIYQLLSYYCLAQRNQLPITHIGLILPLQLKIIKVDLACWDWQPFYAVLMSCITRIQPIDINFWYLYNQYVGHHCHKKDVLTLNRPALQFFISGNISASVKFTPQFKKQLTARAKLVPIFIHSPYCLNLCRPGHGVKKDDDKIAEELGLLSWGGWTFYCLKQLFEFSIDVGIKGIVIHTGRTCGHDYWESVDVMREAIMAISQWATPECPLLLETPAGQKGETLTKLEEFILFYQLLPDFVKNVTAVCVDSMHVYSANYDPDVYLHQLYNSNIPIKLIHFNDSKVVKGRGLDRHAHIGKGYIGYDILTRVLVFGVKHNIPMVTE